MDDKPRVDRRTLLKLLGMGAASPAILPHVAQAESGLRPQVRHGEGLAEEVPSLCDMCFWRCGILAKVRGGRVVRVEGNPDHPRSRGRLCARGIEGWRQLEDPDRLRTPLLRVGKRGEGRWKPISWDRALDLWASKTKEAIEKQGPGAIGLFSHGLSSHFINDFVQHLGSPNRSVPSFGQCRGPRDVGFQLTFGEGPGSPARHDMSNSRMIVLFGSHIGENIQTGQVAELTDALSRGARLVVVDPRMSVAAGKAQRWLPIRPGTDTALLLAWIHLLIAEDCFDHDYVERYTIGLDELRCEMAPYTPKWAAQVTQLPLEAIVTEAREMAKRRPAVMIHCGRFSTWYGNDTQRSRAMAILTALLGAWGRPGGYFLKSKIKLGPGPCPAPHGPMAESVATGRHRFTHFGVAAQELIDASIGKQAPVRQWILWAVNPIQSLPGSKRTREALGSLDFVTMVDILPTEGAMWADLILPEASYLERYDDILAVGDHPRPFVAIRQPVVSPRGEARGPYWIVQQLAHRLGHKDCFTHPNVEAFLDARLAPVGIGCEGLARKGIHLLEEQLPYLLGGRPHSFKTPSRKIELSSATLQRGGYDSIPRFEPVAQPREGWFRLITGRSPYHAFARTQNNPRLMAKDQENMLWVNDEVARAKGLRQGARVFLQNEDGVRTGPIKLLLTPAIRPDAVYTVHGFGGQSRALKKAFGKGVSDNILSSRYAVDPPTGATGFRVNFVQLVRRDGSEISGSSKACQKAREAFSDPPKAEGSLGPRASDRPPRETPGGTTPVEEPARESPGRPSTSPPHPRPSPDRQAMPPRQGAPDGDGDTFRVKMEDGC
ncbi:MAG: molybdopterin-dependent oxidoreductase [Polyangia bacterium]|jgi:thiosulfate reductase/polysulfide reductase chain A|nr:molybdopterin-dependent oxidoreductase [Polyangia bacterium]